MKRQGFPRRLRIRRRPEFLLVQRSGQKFQMRHFLVFVAASGRLGATRRTRAREVTLGDVAQPLQPTRMGVTVTRKVGNAVKRNRIKRLVREAFRSERAAFEPGIDMVWVAKRNALETTFHKVVSDMQGLARRLKRGPSVSRGGGGGAQNSPATPAATPAATKVEGQR